MYFACMAFILNLETATSVCSVALARDGRLVSLREVDNGFTHSENLTNFITQVCSEAGIKLLELDAIAVSSGPGSYTGLRIGASTAKGLCYALKKPLISADTLQSLSACYLNEHSLVDKNDLLVPMIDARRMEVYAAGFDNELEIVFPPTAMIINDQSFGDILPTRKIIYFGDGAAKCQDALSKSGRAAFANVTLSAKGMISITEEKFRNKKFEDVSLFEPFYLKEAAIGKQ
jgi:tRNA threonylcarbamoyladenosine biosynthesis protein TsaB